ncbi:MAG TPA: MBL fold metallo-hydrolase [Pyrinomonadaceae bacterium]|nr:MBL fold metallo-hydrolase [Pyrinomonadaceae bacterium]
MVTKKGTKKKAAGKKAAGSNKLSVRVRMYRQGLGDCFLLTFSRGRKKFNMLIDCGVLQGTVDAATLMTEIVNHVHEETGGRLNLVLATHEHWDHISGFAQARAAFDKITFDSIWLGWTEDKNDEQAARLKRKQEQRRGALKKALAKMSSARLAPLRDSINELMEFEGPLGAAGQVSKKAAWDFLVKEKEAERTFCRPGQLLPLEGMEGVRVYVLGPPEDETLLRRSAPKKNSDEVYKQFGLSLEDHFFAAVSRDDEPDGGGADSLAYPFDRHFDIEQKDAKNDPFFQNFYGFGPNAGAEWRRIDDDWLSMAGELALNLDSDTNNTCLAVAIELVESGKVLLFPGDAQVGNWLSWEGLSWRVAGRDGRRKTVKAKDLLARTVFYKVGHHGSHNATLREKGLELMESPELVAMIPVNEKMAKKQRWNHMPLKSLVKRLKEKARGRVLRIDMKGNDLSQMRADALEFMSAAEWNKFHDATSADRLYIEYTISG